MSPHLLVLKVKAWDICLLIMRKVKLIAQNASGTEALTLRRGYRTPPECCTLGEKEKLVVVDAGAPPTDYCAMPAMDARMKA